MVLPTYDLAEAKAGCVQGELQRCDDYALLVFRGEGVAPDLAKAEALWRAGCASDHQPSCARLAMYITDPKASLEPLRIACETHKIAHACDQLRYRYGMNEHGIERDVEKYVHYQDLAVSLYKPICAQDDREACSALSGILGSRPGGEKYNQQACWLGAPLACTLTGHAAGLPNAQDMGCLPKTLVGMPNLSKPVRQTKRPGCTPTEASQGLELMLFACSKDELFACKQLADRIAGLNKPLSNELYERFKGIKDR